ncbi:MarR family winged helix-turn-helix transcriptional regulator [Euzebya tangerina]|uniref:MarR family winged helix-turn-helix transcriptional regulator n=1 Tax=Euzebya tangerina TaxID=591198 RepID=UPI000E30CAE9|nr:MarR family transcriptional regulator [Euzebya tangerina]
MTEPLAATAESVHDSPDLEDAVAFRLHRTNRLLLTHLSRFLRGIHPVLTPEKWFLIARLQQDGPLRQGQLTVEGLEDAPNVSRLVDSLVTSGLLLRERDPSDRRALVISLTDSGRALSDDVLAHTVAERRRVFEGFTEAELGLLTSALDRLDNNVRGLLGAGAGS